MIAVDTNILVYSVREDSPLHEPALRCLAGLAEGADRWAIPWPCVHEFVGIVTHPRIYKPPMPLDDALRQVSFWLESPSLTMLGEVLDYWPRLEALARRARIQGPQIHDARIAAICQTHGVRELWTLDRDFSRFPGLIAVNPLL